MAMDKLEWFIIILILIGFVGTLFAFFYSFLLRLIGSVKQYGLMKKRYIESAPDSEYNLNKEIDSLLDCSLPDSSDRLNPDTRKLLSGGYYPKQDENSLGAFFRRNYYKSALGFVFEKLIKYLAIICCFAAVFWLIEILI
jgi:lysylphosphatidylglycerol synthetase-like protein (DUF2156 family)